MKNIHVIPTDKPSRLYLGKNGNFVFGISHTSVQSNNDSFQNKHIYITNGEEIKEGDWFYTSQYNTIDKLYSNGVINANYCKKIILTTDPDLIAEGVQAIDDEFLEWFVKNPSCELVPIANEWKEKYKIIMPQESTFINPLIDKTMRNVHLITKEQEGADVLHQYLYITSDEEIKEGNYVIWNDKVYKDSKRSFIGVDYSQCKKIILTTDQDLIKDGIQPIDDDFLEWFVKNQSCEDIEISYGLLKPFQSNYTGYIIHLPDTDILEEPKQETLDKKSLYIQDYKSRISALQYVIDFYEILTKEDIVKQKDDYSKQLKDLENE
jgi:hypothetical protein